MPSFSLTSCAGCGGQLPQPFLDLGNTPLANSYLRPEKAGQPEPHFPLAVAYCPACHLVQLSDPVAPEKMFTEYLYFSSYSDFFLEHARRMADTLIDRFRLTKDSRVLEVASNDGYLLANFQRRGIPVLGVEPAGNIAAHAQSRGVPTLNRFFGPDVTEELLREFGPSDVLIGNNVLAHVPKINDFLAAVHTCLNAEGCAVFEFPYLGCLLEHCEFDTIYHEHVFYFSLSAIKILAERAGLQLVDVTMQPTHGGSLRVFLRKSSTEQLASAAVIQMLGDEADNGMTSQLRYDSFRGQVSEVKASLLELLHQFKASGKRVAAYGAPAKGNTLLNYCGIGTDLIDFTVDRSPHKQGLLLPGSRIPILGPQELLKRQPDYAVLLAWNLATEIAEQQKEYLQRGGAFVVPVPKPVILQRAMEAAAAAR